MIKVHIYLTMAAADDKNVVVTLAKRMYLPVCPQYDMVIFDDDSNRDIWLQKKHTTIICRCNDDRVFIKEESWQEMLAHEIMLEAENLIKYGWTLVDDGDNTLGCETSDLDSDSPTWDI